MITSFSSAHCSISRAWMICPSGTRMCSSERPMLTFLRIERPTSATLRPTEAAASMTCWTRWMFDAKQVTMIRPWHAAKTRSRFGPATRSLGDIPGRSAFVESPQSSNRPSRPSSASRETSAGRPSTGVWSNL
jgi:hypothetical protein